MIGELDRINKQGIHLHKTLESQLHMDSLRVLRTG